MTTYLFATVIVPSDGDSLKRLVAALRAELSRHLRGDMETSVAAQVPRPRLAYEVSVQREHVQSELFQHVLHGVVRGHAGYLDVRLRIVLLPSFHQAALLLDVPGGDPALFVVVVLIFARILLALGAGVVGVGVSAAVLPLGRFYFPSAAVGNVQFAQVLGYPFAVFLRGKSYYLFKTFAY
jgi:hypothetical protein